ncbi:hypothetical protein [Longimicrobium sp.]|uniref:hypothetical protein n=1 Tax=Longimicrobium sp. TaxID=2029185 RepID=UPI002C80B2D4|nr:hypothetical protein [Longimicrobium sp.]HSU15676.1 hypothetical protein [Longimicrobium sp.]
MRKLRLDPEELRVETFVPSGGRDGQGTVYGHYSYPNGCFPPSDSDPALESCGYNTCAGITCQQSCNGYTCGCDPVGSAQCDSIGYTYCIKDMSCMAQCLPPR